jgi:hypothetical protein
MKTDGLVNSDDKQTWHIASNEPKIILPNLSFRIGIYFAGFMFAFITIFASIMSLSVPQRQWLAVLFSLTIFGLPSYVFLRLAYRSKITVGVEHVMIESFRSIKTVYYRDIKEIGEVKVKQVRWGGDIVVVLGTEVTFNDGSKYQLNLERYPKEDALHLIQFLQSRKAQLH